MAVLGLALFVFSFTVLCDGWMGMGLVVVVVVAVVSLLPHGLHVDGCAGSGSLCPQRRPGLVLNTV